MTSTRLFPRSTRNFAFKFPLISKFAVLTPNLIMVAMFEQFSLRKTVRQIVAAYLVLTNEKDTVRVLINELHEHVEESWLVPGELEECSLRLLSGESIASVGTNQQGSQLFQSHYKEIRTIPLFINNHMNHVKSLYLNYFSPQTADYLAQLTFRIPLITLLAPLERYSLVRQAESAINQGGKSLTTNFRDYFRQIIRPVGISSLFRGNSASILGQSALMCCQIGFFANIQQLFYPQGQISNPFNFMTLQLGVFVSGFFTHIFTYPLDSVRARLALSTLGVKSKQDFSGVYDCLKKSLERQKSKGIYAGLSLSLIEHQIRFNALINCQQYMHNNGLTFALLAMSIYPIETLRRNYQVNDLGRSPRFKTLKDTFKKIKEHLGWMGFLRGLIPSVMRTYLMFELGCLLQSYSHYHLNKQ